MLASTVQFSTYDQTPVTRPHQTSTPHGEHSGMRCRPALQRSTASVTRGARSLRTQQRAYEPDPHPPRAFHTPKGAVLAAADDAGRTGQRSTLEHHPRSSAAIRDWMAVMSWARLWTTPTRE